MKKRSQKRPARSEKDQLGCMGGLISIFDLRQSRSTRKLLSDRRHGSRHAVGTGISRAKLNMLTNTDDEGQHKNDREGGETTLPISGKTSVKKLIEEEVMNGENDVNKQMHNITEACKDKSRKVQRRTNKKSREIHIYDAEENSCHSNAEKQSSQGFNLEAIMEELFTQIDQKSIENPSLSEDTLREATKAFLNLKFLNEKSFREDLKTHQSKEYMQALQALNTNEELFLKLLQAPNSLLAKHIKNLQDTQIEKEKESKSKEITNCKKSNFFMRKFKFQEKIPPKGNGNPPVSNRIVILKPSTGMENNRENERVPSNFSLIRKLKQAMSKERHLFSHLDTSHAFPHENQNSRENGKENVCLQKNYEMIESEEPKMSEEDSHNDVSEKRMANIYIEAKKHLSEMINNENGDGHFSSRKMSKTLGRILSYPEFNVSPICSPGRDKEHSSITGKIRFSFNNSFWLGRKENSFSSSSPLRKNSDAQSCIPDEKLQVPESKCELLDEILHDNDKVEASCANGDEMGFKAGILPMERTIDSVSEEESNTSDASSESSSLSDVEYNQNSDMTGICDEKEFSECMKLDSLEENPPPSSPPSSSIAKQVYDVNGAIDRPNRPSPISVLEPPLTEDDFSPASTTSQPVDLPMQPLQIQFEEHDYSPTHQAICIGFLLEDRESAFKYVEAVLQASGFSWDEYFIMSVSSDQLLDPSLYDEIELFPTHYFYDQKHLFDCINEVLLEGIERYFCFSHWDSFLKEGKDFINEVWEGIIYNLIPSSFPPRTLDQIMGKDLAKNGSWMNLRYDVEEIGTDIGELILDDLLDDTLSCFYNEGIDNGFSTSSAELRENDSSINL